MHNSRVGTGLQLDPVHWHPDGRDDVNRDVIESHTRKTFSQPIFFFFPNENNKTVKMMREDPNKKEATVKTCEASAAISKKKTNKNWWKILEFGGLICQIKKLENMRETITTCLDG